MLNKIYVPSLVAAALYWLLISLNRSVEGFNIFSCGTTLCDGSRKVASALVAPILLLVVIVSVIYVRRALKGVGARGEGLLVLFTWGLVIYNASFIRS